MLFAYYLANAHVLLADKSGSVQLRFGQREVGWAGVNIDRRQHDNQLHIHISAGLTRSNVANSVRTWAQILSISICSQI
jgi:hypothetical protein